MQRFSIVWCCFRAAAVSAAAAGSSAAGGSSSDLAARLVQEQQVWTAVQEAIVDDGLLDLTYMTEASEGFCMAMFAALHRGYRPVVLGWGHSFPETEGFHPLVRFRAVNVDKSKQVLRFLKWVAAMQSSSSSASSSSSSSSSSSVSPSLTVVSHDGSDAYMVRSPACILEGYRARSVPALWAAEREFYVGWNGSRDLREFGFLKELFPPLPGDDALQRNGARYLNGGAFVGTVAALVQILESVMDTKYVHLQERVLEAERMNDQALASFYFVASQGQYGGKSDMALDSESRVFECMHGRRDDVDYAFNIIGDGGATFTNLHTGTYPCMVHFNGAKELAWPSIRSFLARTMRDVRVEERELPDSTIRLWHSESNLTKLDFADVCSKYLTGASGSSGFFGKSSQDPTVREGRQEI